MGQFLESYRRHFGGAHSSVQLYTGFAAFFAGAAFGLIGILIVLSGDTLIADLSRRRMIGIFIAALGGPLIFMGLQLTLPSRFVIHGIAGIGALICFVGVAMFLQAWPHQWNQPGADRSSQVIGVYTLGLVFLFVTTAMALVVNFVSRHMVLPGHENLDDPFADRDRPVTMDEVLRDIEREVSRQKLTWGGMEDERLPREFLKLRADFGEGATVSKGRAGKVTETLADEMDLAFTSLARLRGVEGRETSGDDDTATAIDALKALRRARQVELEASRWYRFKRWLVLLFTGKRSTQKGTPAGKDRAEMAKVDIAIETRKQTQRPADEGTRGRGSKESGAYAPERPIRQERTR